MSAKKKVPTIRFQGFSEEWEEKKVTDIAKVFIGLVTTMTTHYRSEGVLLIRNSDIKNNRLEFSEDPIFLDEEFADGNSGRKLKIGDVVTVHTGDVGTSAVITENEDNSIGFATIISRPIRSIVDSNYLSVFLNTDTHRFFAVNVSTGDGRTNYNLKDFYKLNVPYPSIAEQTKIGNFFQQLDSLISQQQKKHDKLQNLKKALLQKMFPLQGQSVPELRFQGFRGEWEEKELGEIARISMGQSPIGSNYTNNPEDHILVQGNADMRDGLVIPRVWTKQITKTAEVGDLIFSVRAPVGEVGKTFYNIVVGRGVAAIKANEFIYQSLKKMNEDSYWEELSSGSTFKSINSKDLSKAFVSMTECEEQTKIGNFFQKFDKLLSQQQAQLEKLKNIKKACLEKMFV